MPSKLKYTILDDEASSIDTLVQFLKRKDYLEEYKRYTCPRQFESELNENPSDVFFMDIEMPWKDGLALSRNLKDKKVIIVSGHKERNNEATDLDSYIDFVKKPVSEERLNIALQRLREKFSITQEYIFLRTTSYVERRMKVSDIVKIRIAKDDTRYKDIFFINRKQERAFIRTLEEIMVQLDPKEFIKINRSCIVNKRYIIGKLNRDEIEMEPDWESSLERDKKSPSKHTETIGSTFASHFDTWFR